MALVVVSCPLPDCPASEAVAESRSDDWIRFHWEEHSLTQVVAAWNDLARRVEWLEDQQRMGLGLT